MLTFIRTVLIASTLTFCLSFTSQANDESSAIEKVLMETWNKPDTPLIVSPIVIVDTWAIASWNQGEKGGRALLNQDDKGNWIVYVCGGDTIKDIDTLMNTGMTANQAKMISHKINNAESKIPKERRALFSTFDGVLMMDNEQQYIHHH